MAELPLGVLPALRRMTPQQAEALFDEYGLSVDERQMYVPLVGRGATVDPAILAEPAAVPQSDVVPAINQVAGYRPNVQHYNVDPYRNHWMAAAWILGASYRMLGKMHGITAQSVLQAVDKYLDENRQHIRLGYMLAPEKISEYHTKYYENKLMLFPLSPLQVAQWLSRSVVPDAESTEDAYEEDMR